jgi:cytochrome c peroxidase
MWIFESRGQCWQCHSGDNFSDERFHNTGVSFGTENRDLGRFKVTQKETDRFAMKTPTLRGIAQTAPYMHDGSMASLREVVEFYNRGGSPSDPNLDERLHPLHLSESEIVALSEFLEALSPAEPLAR